jgi:predicted N-formylglutamate amidohydrolase
MQKQNPVSIEAAAAESFTVIAGRADAGLVLLCDHASNAFPPGYGTLGLQPDQLQRHIAYDIGAGEITRTLARSLGVPAVLTHYSRLLIDPNRGLDDPTLIMRLSDGAIVPGNRRLDQAEREKRVERFYRPYHDAIDRVLDRCLATGVAPALLSVHSFTELWRGTPRPWHVGVLWAAEGRLAGPLLDTFRADGDLVVGDNEPYAGQLEGDTLWQHGTLRGLVHAALEVRQDLIGTPAGQRAWARRLERVLRAIASGPHPGLSFDFAVSAAEGPMSRAG